MVREIPARRFRMETCIVFLVVAVIAVAFSQYERLLTFDARITAFCSGYILASGVLGYHFAGWYTMSDTGWFETVSVPIVIALLSCVGVSLLCLTLEAIVSRVPSPYAAFLGAMLLAVKLVVTTGLPTVVIGTCASVVLRFRARAVVGGGA
jgi:hypothetical protein